MPPDWDIEPDDDAEFADDATTERDLRAYKRARLHGKIARLVFILPVAVLLAWTLGGTAIQRSEWMRLVRAGGGEVQYAAADAACKIRPRSGWRGTIGTIPVGTKVEVVSRRTGWALIDSFGNPCWVPDWSLGDERVDLPAIYRCGMRCHAKEPAGWYSMQRQAACARTVLDRLGCAIEDFMKGSDRAGGRDPVSSSSTVSAPG